jgi:hypothetical protein
MEAAQAFLVMIIEQSKRSIIHKPNHLMLLPLITNKLKATTKI